MRMHLREECGYEPSEDLVSELREAVFNRNVMPSMRAIMTSGPALERDNVAGYNCSFLPVDSLRSFDEAMYILMCGTGVGFSVESIYVDKLPTVNEHFESTNTTIVVEDSKAGWAKALRELLALLWQGQVPTWFVQREQDSRHSGDGHLVQSH
jgi:ribonucleoside-triphosphate reductase